MNVPIADLTAVHFRVAAVDTSGNEASSVIRAVVDIDLTPVSVGTTISASHITQLRQAIRLLSNGAGLNPTFTDADDALINAPIKAVHLAELRAHLTQTLAVIGVPPFEAFTDPHIESRVTTVRAVHIAELQERVR